MSVVYDLIEKAEDDITKILVELESEIDQSVKSIKILKGLVKIGTNNKPVRKICIDIRGADAPMWSNDWSKLL